MSLGNWGQSLLNVAANLTGGDIDLKDYQHASKTFRTNSYEYAPKFKFLFHTYFEINPEAYGQNVNYGLLVKEVKLPTFSFQTYQLNQYNRKRIVQTKIKYEPIEITFHDDGGNNVTKLWEAYYRYYYNDASKPQSVLMGSRGSSLSGDSSDPLTSYNDRNIYTDSISGDDDWGFIGGANKQDDKKAPFFKNITVFGLNQHNFTAYTLVNPVITNFSHDTYNYNEGGGIMQNRMTIDYETVVYNYGALDGRDPSQIVTGFGETAHYDTDPSPIMNGGANGTILGQGGLIDAAGGTIQSLTDGNIPGAIRNAGIAYDNIKNPNLVENSALAIAGMFFNTLSNAPKNRNTNFSSPTAGSTPGPLGTASSPTIAAKQKPDVLRNDPTSGYPVDGSTLLNNYNGKGFPVDAPFKTGPIVSA
jgi:hypothetical protein